MTRPARAWLTLALLLTALVYLATLRFEFCMDDIPQIAFNPLLHSWRNLPGFFVHHIWTQVQGAVSSNYYRPLFLAWLLVNFKLFGPNPVWWHSSTLFMHLVATYLAFVVARRVTRSDLGGAIAALLF